jgi:hypothetical protein
MFIEFKLWTQQYGCADFEHLKLQIIQSILTDK